MEIKVIKYDGSVEPFMPEKLTKWANYAAQNGGDWLSIASKVYDLLPSEVSSEDIHNIMTQVCVDEQTLESSRMAARLEIAKLWKNMERYIGVSYNSPFKDIYNSYIEKGIWCGDSLPEYNPNWENWYKEGLKEVKEHWSLVQWSDKYSLRKNGKPVETPHAGLLASALALHGDNEDAKKMYFELIGAKLMTPTPALNGLRNGDFDSISCFVAGSEVMTSEGMKCIEDIKRGDVVLSADGSWNKVILPIKKKYSGKMVEVDSVLGIGGRFVSTENHEVLAVKVDRIEEVKSGLSNKVEWIRADNLRHRDLVKVPFCKEVVNDGDTIWDIVKDKDLHYKFELIDGKIVRPLKYPTVEEKSQPDINNVSIYNKDLFRVFGYYLADGSIPQIKGTNGASQVMWTFNINEREYQNDVKEVLSSLGARVKSYDNLSDNSTKLVCTSKPIVVLFKELLGIGSGGKTIDKRLMVAPPDLQKELLVGVLRGDGCAVISGYTLDLGNKGLVMQLKDLALRNRLPVSINKGRAPRKENHLQMYKLQINVCKSSDFVQSVGKNLHKIRVKGSKTRTHVLFDSTTGDAFVRIRGIKSSYVEGIDVFDLSVENVHSYTVDSLAVHNCSLFESADSKESILVANYLTQALTAKKAGIGNYYNTRSKGDPVRGGAIEHIGKMPIMKEVESGTKILLQLSRGGSATTTVKCIDPEIVELIYAKSQRTSIDTRVDKIDYSFAFNDAFLDAVKEDDPWYLFSLYDAPEVYDAFHLDAVTYRRVVQEALNRGVKHKEIRARELLKHHLIVRQETGRYYAINLSRVNEHTPFVDKINQANL